MSKRFLHTAMPWIGLAHSGLFLLFWLTNSLFYAQTNDWLAGKLGTQLDFIRLCLLLAGSLVLWSLARLVLARFDRRHRLYTLTTVLHSIFVIVFLLFFYGSFWLLFQESPSQVRRIQQMLLYYRLILDTLVLLAAAWLGRRYLRMNLRTRPVTGWNEVLRCAAPPAGLLLLVWLLPLVFTPGSVYRDALPAKPLIIAHRGASFVAPENTIPAAELAASLGVFGLETDLHISLDGQPFLMHDDTLKRTTDVAVIFPGRERERAERFTLAEIRQLNAGQWFLETDPHRTITSQVVLANQLSTYQQLLVPTLAEELEVVRASQAILIFDLKQPPEGHPYRQQFFDIVFQQVREAGIDSQIWFLANPEQAAVVRAQAPQMTLVHGTSYQNPLPASDLLSQGYRVVNTDFGISPKWIKTYQQAGLWVNLYTVDEPWQFSRLWLLGVNSITSSNALEVLSLQAPVFSLPYLAYLILWTILVLLAFGVLLFMTRPAATRSPTLHNHQSQINS